MKMFIKQQDEAYLDVSTALNVLEAEKLSTCLTHYDYV